MKKRYDIIWVTNWTVCGRVNAWFLCNYIFWCKNFIQNRRIDGSEQKRFWHYCASTLRRRTGTRIWQYSCGWLLFFSERYRWRTHGRYSCWCWWKYGYKSICIWRKRHRIIYKIIDKTKNIEKNIRRYFGIWSSGMDNGFRSIRNSLIWFGWSGTNTENIPLPIKKTAFPYIYTP